MYGLSTPYGLTKEQCWTVPPCSYLLGRPAYGPSCTEFVHPGCWHFDNGAGLGLGLGGLGSKRSEPGLDNTQPKIPDTNPLLRKLKKMIFISPLALIGKS